MSSSAPSSAEQLRAQFAAQGYLRFPFAPEIARWAEAARGAGVSTLSDPAHAHWWRHRRTWFVGVDALPNDPEGIVPGGPPFSGAAIDFIRRDLGFTGAWHRAQVSACFPGYPLQDDDESEVQHRFRLTRDAAHVDGLHGEGPERRRHMREFHAFILGLPLTDATADAAPLVVWAGSHIIMQEVFAKAFAGVPPGQWGDVDVTQGYQAARKRVFAECPRIALPARPGEATLVHCFTLHGVAPWGEHASASPQGRMIAYFRPEMTDRISWLG
mgnify:CR=1 FL=1|jgi:hypothetical protein